jgi:hypothetical protein
VAIASHRSLFVLMSVEECSFFRLASIRGIRLIRGSFRLWLPLNYTKGVIACIEFSWFIRKVDTTDWSIETRPDRQSRHLFLEIYEMTIKFAQRLFLAAGIYGVAVVAPLFFLESQIARYDPPAITHPEFYYGFVCVALAWQIVYLMMSRDPLGLRPVLFPAIAGKAGFAVSVSVLFVQQRLAAVNLVLPSIDLLLAACFAWTYVALGRERSS